ncbi:prolipoprotein diacylglyceryl transferase [Plantactinospora sonchi]|uniref:Phosphatidylglycerol--prolipoprotein diacylglyceryl transferase n=1 Tax=Plantactinospora sonchi TaxID=1544735 RepID=A0ABU7RWD2_9ACTN
MTLASLTPQAALPSPATAVWQLGPVPVRAYALCIVLGIVVACVVTELRLRRRGVAPWAVLDIAVWAVPFGIVGARIYHVITSPGAYFGEDGDPIRALYIWEGGLGIWGAVAGGAVGAWLAVRQLGLPLTLVADALAPGLPLAQAVGRIGNWFNNELFGGPTTLPWGLEVHRMDPANPGQALRDDNGNPVLEPGLFHPTFLYEALWNVGVAVLVYALDRRFRFGRGRAFALYVMGYTAGRFWIEMMRTDSATHFLGVRLNVWTAALVFLGALVYFVRVRGPQQYVIPVGVAAEPVTATGGDVSQVDVSRARQATAVAPSGYRVVTEEQFQHHQRTGEAPPEDGDPAGDDTPGADGLRSSTDTTGADTEAPAGAATATPDGTDVPADAADGGNVPADAPDGGDQPADVPAGTGPETPAEATRGPAADRDR